LAFLLAEQSECSDILQQLLIDAGLISAQEAEALFSQFFHERELSLESTVSAGSFVPTDGTAAQV
jgi:hypothetical protein